MTIDSQPTWCESLRTDFTPRFPDFVAERYHPLIQYVVSLFFQRPTMATLIRECLSSLDWFKGKSTGNIIVFTI
jgi:chromosome condensin MukBEF MukE localization factor